MNIPFTVDETVAPLLSSLAAFTELREQEALSVSLGRAIRDLTNAKSVTLYRLLSKEGQPSLIATAAWHAGLDSTVTEGLPPESPLSAMPVFDVALASRKMSRQSHPSEDFVTLVLPLSGSHEMIEGFFLVEGVHADQTADRVLHLLLEIYRNFLDLLRDNQHDLLTGLLNRKTFDTRIGNVLVKLNSPHLRKHDDEEGQYCLAIMDIDHFKRINDNFGHLYGDEVLLLISNMMQESFREGDALFRFGGEEFVALIKDVDISTTGKILERFRLKVEARDFPQVGKVTLSIGFTAIRAGELPPQIIDRADRALYFGKGNGRNQVCAYETLVEEGLLDAPEVSQGSIELF